MNSKTVSIEQLINIQTRFTKTRPPEYNFSSHSHIQYDFIDLADQQSNHGQRRKRFMFAERYSEKL